MKLIYVLNVARFDLIFLGMSGLMSFYESND